MLNSMKDAESVAVEGNARQEQLVRLCGWLFCGWLFSPALLLVHNAKAQQPPIPPFFQLPFTPLTRQ